MEPTVGLIFHDGGLDADPAFVAAVSEDDGGGDDIEGDIEGGDDTEGGEQAS